MDRATFGLGFSLLNLCVGLSAILVGMTITWWGGRKTFILGSAILVIATNKEYIWDWEKAMAATEKVWQAFPVWDSVPGGQRSDILTFTFINKAAGIGRSIALRKKAANYPVQLFDIRGGIRYSMV